MDRRLVIGGLDVTSIVYRGGLGKLVLASEDDAGQAELSNLSVKLSNMYGEMTPFINSGAIRTPCKLYVPYGLVFDGVLGDDGFQLDRDNETVEADFVDYSTNFLQRIKNANLRDLDLAIIPARARIWTEPPNSFGMYRWFTEVKYIIRRILARFDPGGGGVQFQFGTDGKTYYVGGTFNPPPLPDMSCYDFINEIAAVFHLVWGRGLNGSWFFVDKYRWMLQRRSVSIDLPRFKDSVVVNTKLTGATRVTFSYENAPSEDETQVGPGILFGEIGEPEGSYSRGRDVRSAFSCPYDPSRTNAATIPSTQLDYEGGVYIIESGLEPDLLDPNKNKFVRADYLLGNYYDIELRALGEVSMRCSLMDEDSVNVARAVFPYAHILSPTSLPGYLHARNTSVDLREETMEITAMRYSI